MKDFFNSNRAVIYSIFVISVFLLVAFQWIAHLPNEKVLITEVVKYPVAQFETNYYYLGINFFTILFPLLLSFDKKIAFYKNWKYIFPSIFIVGILFIIWDIFFTVNSIWGFNENYLSGIEIFHLPLEEWLFFLTIPYACIFIFECLYGYQIKNPLKKYTDQIYLIFILGFFLLGIMSFGKVYFSSTCFLTSLFLTYQFQQNTFENRSYIILTYIISWFPFMLVNGMLTGLFTSEPVVMYNPTEFSGIRILSVPLDDSIYSLLLISMNLEIFKRLKKNLEI